MRAMKNSGIEWEPNIPETWEIRKAKYCGVFSGNGVDKKTQENGPLFKSVHYMDVYRNSLHEIRNSADYLVVSATDTKATDCALFQGDVLLTSSSETPEDIGHSVVVAEDLDNTLMGYHLMRFRPTIPMNLRFSKYLFGSHNMRSWFEYRATGMTRYGLSYSDYSTARMILPPLHEQNRVANFLDDKCAQIDAILEKQQQVIEKLKDYKQSIITEAVTKGLDPTVPMKDSGVEWIGKLPDAWILTALKRIMRLINGRAYSDSELLGEGKYRILRVGNLFTNPNWYYSDMELDEDKYCDMGDLLYAWSASFGPYIWQDEKVIFHYHIWKVALSELIEKKYAFYALQALTQCIASEKHGSAMAHVTMEKMNSSLLPVPSIREQQEIADFIEKRCAAIDYVISLKEAGMSKLNDYKKSLIYEAVTGKMEV